MGLVIVGSSTGVPKPERSGSLPPSAEADRRPPGRVDAVGITGTSVATSSDPEGALVGGGAGALAS